MQFTQNQAILTSLSYFSIHWIFFWFTYLEISWLTAVSTTSFLLGLYGTILRCELWAYIGIYWFSWNTNNTINYLWEKNAYSLQDEKQHYVCPKKTKSTEVILDQQKLYNICKLCWDLCILNKMEMILPSGAQLFYLIKPNLHIWILFHSI